MYTAEVRPEAIQICVYVCVCVYVHVHDLKKVWKKKKQERIGTERSRKSHSAEFIFPSIHFVYSSFLHACFLHHSRQMGRVLKFTKNSCNSGKEKKKRTTLLYIYITGPSSPCFLLLSFFLFFLNSTDFLLAITTLLPEQLDPSI